MDDHYEGPTPSEVLEQKKLLYEKMTPRRRKFVDRIGFDNWDPFQAPFDPIDIRKECTGYTSQELTELFLRSREKRPGPDYASTVAEFNVLLVTNTDRVKPIFDFCIWYAEHLARYGKSM